MARPRTIDRDLLLDAAETIVTDMGVAGLSFANVAKRAGVSKGGVQATFGTRDALIEAMLNRWLLWEGKRFNSLLRPKASDRDRVRAHLTTMSREDAFPHKRLATLLATFVGSDKRFNFAAEWYAARIGDFIAVTPEARQLRIAFLAAEGVFFVRHMAGLEIEEDVWQQVFEDLFAMVRDAGDADERPAALAPSSS